MLLLFLILCVFLGVGTVISFLAKLTTLALLLSVIAIFCFAVIVSELWRQR